VLARAARPGLGWRWRRELFAFLVRNAGTPGRCFGLPPNRTVELGTQLEV
jgi:K+ transporter